MLYLYVLQCIEFMGKGCLTDEQIQELVRFLDKTLTEHFTRQAARQGLFLLLYML